ncbi:hypothetical protein GOZ90_09605 [Agrobacterium vitis]|uniref:Uncharacterized protein n=1 Tax=Agrobacterium vitis TaxID=373 RepID=A0A6L6VFB5_AGRVI|nr:hypothetical protein [Agrobacterium vitis]MUZ72937.1 hypothetical protein [Agrobacterium vitis]
MSNIVETNRRRFVLGLAAASAAAISEPAAAKAAENPKLVALADELPAIAQQYNAANLANQEMKIRWRDATPLAPDEISERGLSKPHLCDQAINEDIECSVLGGYLYREGEQYPRRIKLRQWDIWRELLESRRIMCQAQKAGSVADFLAAEEDVKRLKALYTKVKVYEAEYSKLREAAIAEGDRLSEIKLTALTAFARHVDAIIAEDDRTMEGLVIKAEALVEWSRVEKIDRALSSLNNSVDWHSSIAKSILRYAEGGNV